MSSRSDGNPKKGFLPLATLSRWAAEIPNRGRRPEHHPQERLAEAAQELYITPLRWVDSFWRTL